MTFWARSYGPLYARRDTNNQRRKDMKIAKYSFLVIAVVLLSLMGSTGVVRSDDDRHGDEHHQQLVRWDIISLQVIGGVPNLFPNGVASARAEDSSKITVTGS